jgi:DNA (cytosine-5)-methyltransferase 1
MRTIIAADLFCGAGGTSSGLYKAAHQLGCDVHLLAINHWQIAIATHSANHPDAEHRCENLDNVDPRKAVPDGYLDLLVASPECTHHSRARGGRPISDQSRASAWHILRWAEALYIENILIENVPEFRTWGPIGKNDQPVQSLKGKTYLAFLEALRSLGYNVDARVINTANYGDPTTRNRLFIMARRENPVVWPEPTHSKDGGGFGFLAKTSRWKPACDIIDWTIPGESIFTRKKPLSPNTLRRIEAGLKKYCGLPFILGQQSCAAPRTVDEPVPTVAGAGAISLVEPFLIMLNGTKESVLGATAKSIDDPVPTITSVRHIGLVEPFLVEYHGSSYPGGERTHSIHDPMPTVATSNQFGLCEPFIVALNHGKDVSRTYPISEPMKAITSVDAWGLVEPFIVKYNSTGGPASINDPLDTVTAKDRFGLVVPLSDGKEALLDIRFRMLQPHELAAAMSFPKDYQFSGNREQKVKQIGNAVPVNTAAALCKALLS